MDMESAVRKRSDTRLRNLYMKLAPEIVVPNRTLLYSVQVQVVPETFKHLGDCTILVTRIGASVFNVLRKFRVQVSSACVTPVIFCYIHIGLDMGTSACSSMWLPGKTTSLLSYYLSSKT